MMQSHKSWKCPYCQNLTVIDSNCHRSYLNPLNLDSADGYHILVVDYIVCQNSDCRKHSLKATLHEGSYNGPNSAGLTGDEVNSWSLVPPSDAKPFPDYIPKAIRDDYNEACLIKDLSPKASAALSRRCLQGMIRNFWGVQKRTLFDEIVAIEGKVDPLTLDAIKALKDVGNVGAHMEEDVNCIIDIQPHEAEFLIGLIETFFQEWYIDKHEKEKRRQRVAELGNKVTEARKKPKEA